MANTAIMIVWYHMREIMLVLINSQYTPENSTYVSLVPRLFIKKRPGNLPEFKLLISAALELAIPIRFQNASRDRCSISIAS